MTSQKTPNQINQKQEKYIGWHVVAIFDLLGQQDALRNLTVLPNPDNKDEFDEFKSKVENFYAPFYAIRSFFTSSIKTFQEGGLDISLLPPEQQELLKKFRKSPIFIRHFSDSVIVNVPLKKDISQFPSRAIYGILAAAAQTMVACMAHQIVLRGGIELGIAMTLDENEIYGPALARAHTLESKVAQYPRIVIGQELTRYLHAVSQQPPTGLEETVNSGFASKALELLAVDDDGQVFLDYLGTHFRDRLQQLTTTTDAIRLAYNFIIEQSIRHKETRNSKLGFRYTLIRNYFESRLPLWGISADIE